MSYLDPLVINLAYAFLGGALSLFMSWIASVTFQYRMGFKLRDALAEGNLAVGIVMLGIFIGNGIGVGIIIGLSLN